MAQSWTRIIGAVLLLLAIAGCANDVSSPPGNNKFARAGTNDSVRVMPEDLKVVVDDLLQALRRQERVGLARFTAFKDDFGGKYGEEIYEYAYGNGGLYEQVIRRGNTVYHLDHLAEHRGMTHAIVFFYPKEYAAEMRRDRAFLKETHMVHNFACEFARMPQGWLMEYNFCFYATDSLFGCCD